VNGLRVRAASAEESVRSRRSIGPCGQPLNVTARGPAGRAYRSSSSLLLFGVTRCAVHIRRGNAARMRPDGLSPARTGRL